MEQRRTFRNMARQGRMHPGPRSRDGLGTPDAQSADLMSYLLFDSRYTRALVDIGHHDADARIGGDRAVADE
jgi:hypothetical protein